MTAGRDGVPSVESSSDLASGEGPKRSHADILLDAAADAELFHSSDRTAFARVRLRGGRLLTSPIRSSDFRDWLIRRFRETSRGAPSSQSLDTALRALEAEAVLDGAEREVFLRVGGGPTVSYFDLADDDGRMVCASATGWSVVRDADVRFRRSRYMAPVAEPAANGDLNELRELLGLADDDRWRLLVSWMVFALRPPGSGTYPVLVLTGQQDSGKSTTARAMRALLDPNRAGLRGEPKEPQELLVMARNSWCVAIDNLSRLPEWMSDWLCRLADGTGLSKRELWTNEDEWVLSAQRPVVINGIGDLAQRGDLLSRALVIELNPLTGRRRLTEREFWRRFDAIRSRTLGALLDALVAGIARESTVDLPEPPRLADFARLGTAIEPAMGWDPGAFVRAHAENQATGDQIVLEESPLVPPLRLLLDNGAWEGTASDLLDTLTELAGEQHARRLPKAANSLSGHLQRLAPSLRAIGITFERMPPEGKERRRQIRLEIHPRGPIASSASRDDGPHRSAGGR